MPLGKEKEKKGPEIRKTDEYFYTQGRVYYNGIHYQH